MGLLNRQAYAMEKDRLIYDAKHPIDAAAVRMQITAEEGGTVKRGQVLDYADTDGKYRVHTEGGEARVIVAEDAEYAPEDTEITVVVYISGTFRASEVIAEPEITDSDIETLRGNGIYLK